MRRLSDRGIGTRAADEIRKRCQKTHVTCANEMRTMGLNVKAFYSWKLGDTAPDARSLQALTLGGYDIMYILTGRRQE